jgi:quercetin dioxygenase-like cupin family protein
VSEITGIARVQGKLLWSDYEFHEAGDKIPMHEHGETDSHMTIVLKGSVRVTGDGSWEPIILKTGERCIFLPGQMHEITALEPGTMTMHPIY